VKLSARLGRFDLQVGLILVLLVLFLGILDLMNVFLLVRSLDTVERVERTTAALAAGRLADAVGEDALIEALRSERRKPSDVASTLRRESARLGITRAHLRDRAGRDLAGIPRSGSEVPGPPLDRTGADDLAALQAGRQITFRVDSEDALDEVLMVGVVPLLDTTGKLVGTLEAWRPAPDLAALDRRVGRLLVIQIVGLALVALVAVLFANWVSRPYRRLAAAAGKAGLTPAGTGSGPEQLEKAFRAVLDKLRDQEEAIGSVGREGGALGDLVRFASRSASGMTTGVLVVDRGGTVAALNDAAAGLLGVDASRAKNEPLSHLLPHTPRLGTLVRDCVERGKGASREVLAASLPDGRTRHLGVSLSPSVGRSGEVTGVLILMTDLTEIRELQEHARLRENLASVGRLSAGIAHEFRNALGTILGYARMLEKRDEARVRGPAREIVREVDTVRKTVDEFLLFARPPEPKPTRVDLGRLVRRCAATAPERIEVVVEGSYGFVHADEGLLRRVFENLLRNAADAAEETEKRVTVRVTGRPVAGGRTLQVEVEDDGPGIPAERLERVFEPFYTSRARGTGLGLALVQRTIVDLGGTVEAATGTTGGALFRLRLPLV
jgi:PAS domain S-box-containing protein